jgi:predicted TIM-barrel fold metal-dependent hydrolase
MKTKLIDIHQHVPADTGLDARVKACEETGVVKQVLLGLPESREPGDNARVLKAHRLHPDLFIPFYGVDMDIDGPGDILRARDRGFTGLKFIGPLRPYNDRSYFPFYETAAELKMPVLFHLGIVANTDRWRDCDSNLMRPIHLDHIARRMPELTLIGAHFGNPWCEEAAMACRWNPNLFYDLSGSLLKYRSPHFLNELLWWKPEGPYPAPDKTFAWQKILFGTDVASHQMEDVRQDYDNLMVTLKLDAERCSAIWHDTAARILNLDPLGDP